MSYLKKNLLVILAPAFLLFAWSCSQQEKRLPADYVDPFICSEGDHGQWDPSALVPSGLVKLGPDTYPGSLTGDGDYAHSGYNYSDSIFRGFSHFHKGSSGGGRVCDRAGKLSILPFSHEPTDTFMVNPLAAVDKKTEKASPGYFSVDLKEDGIHVELTATGHVGVHRYTFQPGRSARLYLNPGKMDHSWAMTLNMIDDKGLEGVLSVGAGIHFIVCFDRPVLSTTLWTGDKMEPGNSLEQVRNGGIVCDFGDLEGKPLMVKVAVSLTTQDAAKNNLQAECPGWDFDRIRQQAVDQWNAKLGHIKVEGNEEYKTIFYTALYHSCFLPVVLSDVSGKYPGLDGQVHQAKGYKYYYDYAFWDSFRTKYPLYSLYNQETYKDIIRSLVDICEQADNCGPFPQSTHLPHSPGFEYYGKNGYQPFGNCRNEHMLMVMTDAYEKGLFGPDMKKVYPYLRKEAMIQMPEKYDSIGYIPARPDQTGEYCWDSWCVAQVAKSIVNGADYNYFMKRSEYWKNTWDPSLRFFRARAADGSWLDFPEDPGVNREKYTYEGTAWQYRWNILHDIPSLIEAFGGKENFVKELEYFFDHDLYTAGNQPDLQAPFLFNPASASWLSQKWVHKILTEPMVQRYGTHNFFPKPINDRIYKTTPDGYLEEMDDDYGCMSSWYAMASMGFYQICPGSPVFQLTSPVFDKIIIRPDVKDGDSKTFTIEAKNLSPSDYYIQSATLNGKPLNRSWLNYDEIARGGKLIYEMGSDPNKNWGTEN